MPFRALCLVFRGALGAVIVRALEQLPLLDTRRAMAHERLLSKPPSAITHNFSFISQYTKIRALSKGHFGHDKGLVCVKHHSF